jgi:hypothetical protein
MDEQFWAYGELAVTSGAAAGMGTMDYWAYGELPQAWADHTDAPEQIVYGSSVGKLL